MDTKNQHAHDQLTRPNLAGATFHSANLPAVGGIDFASLCLRSFFALHKGNRLLKPKEKVAKLPLLTEQHIQLAQDLALLIGNGNFAGSLRQPFKGHKTSENQVQRMPLRIRPNTTLARISIRQGGSTPAEGQLRFVNEVVPEGQRPGRFEGYPDRLGAQLALPEERVIFAVVQDTAGSFHLIRTDWPRISRDSRYEIIPLENAQVRRLYWVALRSQLESASEGGPRSWSQRARRAREWTSDWVRARIPVDFPSSCIHEPRHEASRAGLRSCLESEYVDLLVEILNVDRGSFHVASRSRDWRPDAVVNFDLELESVGRGGIGILPIERTGSLPRPVLVVGPQAFISESTLYTLSTLVHEQEHGLHARRSISLLRRWRSSRSGQSFVAWLHRERQAGRISNIDYDLAVGYIAGGERSTSETLAYLQGFISVYHRLPITRTLYRFHQLDSIAEYWPRAGHETQDQTIQRLSLYYNRLSPQRQEDVAGHVRSVRDRSGENGRLFWERFIRIVLRE
jgi:hypothetical protein